jgi:MOSC domain-containing protein YiiM
MKPPKDTALAALAAVLPRPGRVDWIGLRPARNVPMREVATVQAVAGHGLQGDRYDSGSGARGLTLIQAEHLPAIAAFSARRQLAPAVLRRNLVVSGLPVMALLGRRFRIGSVLLEGTQPCDPCARMEAALGPGGYNAMTGMGGLCARILEGGVIALGDPVVPQES